MDAGILRGVNTVLVVANSNIVLNDDADLEINDCLVDCA